MKKIGLFALILCLMLSLCACGGGSGGKKSGAKTTENAKSCDDLLDLLRSDSPYRAWTFSGEEDGQEMTLLVETYTTADYTYFSLICEEEGIDWIIRYNPDNPNETLQTTYKGGWVSCVETGDVESAFRKENVDRFYSIIITEGDLTDTTTMIDGKDYDSKRLTLEDDIYVDYVCRDGAWDAVALTARGDGTAIYENFVFADKPTKDSRLYDYLKADVDKSIVAMRIASDSMYPAFGVDDLCYFRKVDTDTLAVGDVVLFLLGEDMYAAHRIIEIDGYQFYLKGDANSMPNEDPTHAAYILGVWINE